MDASAIGLALLGLALFVVGQLYGQYRVKIKAEKMIHMIRMGIDGYRTALSAVLKVRGLDIIELDKEAFVWNMQEVQNKLKAEFEEGMKSDDKKTEDK